jgi:hypothetical protein
MSCFRTKFLNFGTFWKAFGWKSVMYFVAIWYSHCHLGTFYGHLVFGGFLVYFVPLACLLYQEKSGNLGLQTSPISAFEKLLHFSATKCFF